jgi:hypothetical protein
MAPDSFESEQLASDNDMAGEAETPMQEPQPAAPPPARLSLFQRVCLGNKPQGKAAT